MENERKIDIFFPPVRLANDQFACLEMNFAVSTYFEVKLAYAAATDNSYKERVMFRSVESFGEEFQSWKTTITPNTTDGEAFVVVLHSEGTSPGTMVMIQSINLQNVSCTTSELLGDNCLFLFLETMMYHVNLQFHLIAKICY